MDYKLINGTHLNVRSIKKISLSKFKEQFEVRIGENTESVYYEITGKVKKEKPKKKKKEEAPE